MRVTRSAVPLMSLVAGLLCPFAQRAHSQSFEQQVAQISRMASDAAGRARHAMTASQTAAAQGCGGGCGPGSNLTVNPSNPYEFSINTDVSEAVYLKLELGPGSDPECETASPGARGVGRPYSPEYRDMKLGRLREARPAGQSGRLLVYSGYYVRDPRKCSMSLGVFNSDKVLVQRLTRSNVNASSVLVDSRIRGDDAGFLLTFIEE